MTVKQRLVQIGLVLLAGLLFPYMTVLLASQNGITAGGEELIGSRWVVLADGSRMDSESYLAGILGKQIAPDYPFEVLKAQAVLARTWLYQAIGDGDCIEEEELKEYRWDGTWMQDTYGEDYLEVYKRFYQAVQKTAGQTAWYEDSRITPLYHALSAGQTRFDTSGVCPYLIGRECNFDLEAEHFLQVRIMEKEEFWRAVREIDPQRQPDGTQEDVSLLIWNTDEAGYVLSVTAGSFTFTGQELQEALSLSSPWIRADVYGTQIRVLSKGVGHGYGLSQWEAKRLAENGYDYQKLLGYFFHGITIKSE